MSGVALYVLAQEYQAAAAQLADLDLDEQCLADTLESLTGDLDVKAHNVAMFMRGLESTIDGMKKAEAMMTARRKSAEKRAEAIQTYLLNTMVACNIKKIEGPMLTLSLRDNPEAVTIFDEKQIPADYWRTPEPPPPPVASPDKMLLKKAMQDGFEIPGAKLTRGIKLVIK